MAEPVASGVGSGASQQATTSVRFSDATAARAPDPTAETTSATTATSLNNDSSWSSRAGNNVINSEQVQRAYQSFVEAEHMTDGLMPSISAPVPVLKDHEVL